MKKEIALLAILIFSVSCVYSFETSYETTKNLNLSVEGIDTFEIDSGAGSLEIRGIDGLEEIEVTAEIIVKGKSEKRREEFIEKNMKLSLKKKGNKAILVSGFKESSLFSSFRQKVINLTVKMPKNLDLDIDDGSGGINIEDLTGDLKVDDGSGSIDIENIKGNVNIHDGSGDIEVRDVSGDVSVNDGSGSIHVQYVEGSVTVSDGSGSISVNDVEKDVHIKNDGSGSVNIENVKGRVIK